MADNKEPMIKLEPGGKAPILSYNVPEPTSYTGRNLIELKFPQEYFKPALSAELKKSALTPLVGLEFSALQTAVASAMKTGFADKKIFPNVRTMTGTLRFVGKSNPGMMAVSSLPLSAKLANLDPDEVASMMNQGMMLNVYTSLFGTLTYNYIPAPTVVRPRLFLVETYRLTSFLGAYGAGRTIKTFSLLPGEKTKISVKTYMKRETDAKSASSILDSFSQDSADDFETQVQAEQSDKSAYAENFEYHAEAEASCSWGFGSAKVSGGVKGGSNSAREEFAKNVSNATEKHASKSSAKRDVQIDTSYEVKEQTGEETSVEREIQNINVSRTLNFVFRQMNQEYLTLLHLVDVRVAYFNGCAESKREVALPDLDSLLEEVIVDAATQNIVRQTIIDELSNIFDYEDKHHSFVEEREIKDKDGNVISKYWRAKKDPFTYIDPATGTERTVTGIVMSARKNILRTEGIIVEALLGQGDGLDEYSHGLQDEAVRAKALANDLLQSQVKREELGQTITKEKDEAAMKIFQGIFPPPVIMPPPPKIEVK